MACAFHQDVLGARRASNMAARRQVYPAGAYHGQKKWADAIHPYRCAGITFSNGRGAWHAPFTKALWVHAAHPIWRHDGSISRGRVPWAKNGWMPSTLTGALVLHFPTVGAHGMRPSPRRFGCTPCIQYGGTKAGLSRGRVPWAKKWADGICPYRCAGITFSNGRGAWHAPFTKTFCVHGVHPIWRHEGRYILRACTMGKKMGGCHPPLHIQLDALA